MFCGLVVIIVSSLLPAGCRSADTESADGGRAIQQQAPLPAYEAPTLDQSQFSTPSRGGESTAVVARGRQVLIMDQSVSMLGFSRSGSLRAVEDAVGRSFRGIVGHDEATHWQFFGVTEQLKLAKPPLAEVSRMTGKATNLEAAIDLLAEPDVALGILVTDGLPSGFEARRRPCYDLTLPSVEAFAQAFSKTLATGSGLWIVLARVPFEGNSYLNCSEIAGHLLPRLQKAFGGMKPKCIGATRGGCRCGGECRVPYNGVKPILLFVVSKKQLVEKTRVAVTRLVDDLRKVEGVDNAVAMELYPGTPDSWVLDGDVYSYRLDLRNVGAAVRTTSMTEEPKGSGRWFGKNFCIEGEDNEVIIEVCARRVPSPVAMSDSLEISQPEIRFEAAGVHTDAKRMLTTRILAPEREFLVWDRGMIHPREPGLVRANEMASCQELFEMVRRHPEWCRPVPNARRSEWCRQVVVSCGCLEQEGKMAPGHVVRVVMDLYYTQIRDDRVPEEIASYSIEREPYLHPDKIYGLASFIRGVLLLAARNQQSPVEHRFGHLELTISRPE